LRTVTLKDIADRVGVDRSTVSRVLRDRSDEIGISQELARRVKAAADELRYTPNTSARAIRSGQFGAASLLLSTVRGRSYLPSALLDGIHDELLADNMHLTIAKVPDEILRRRDGIPKVLREHLSDGLLINYTHNLPQALLDAVDHARIPSVWINAARDHDAVNPLNFEAAQTATRRLIEHGHRRIAYVDLCAGVAELPTAHFSAHDRRDGYAAAMREAGLEPLEWRPPRTLGAFGDGEQFLRARFLETPRPTALLCYFSIFLPRVWRVCIDLGLQVPRDLSVVTFAPELWHEVGVNADCMLEPHAELGRAAVQLLRRLLKQPGGHTEALGLKFKLLPLGTVASPND